MICMVICASHCNIPLHHTHGVIILHYADRNQDSHTVGSLRAPSIYQFRNLHGNLLAACPRSITSYHIHSSPCIMKSMSPSLYSFVAKLFSLTISKDLEEMSRSNAPSYFLTAIDLS